MIMKLMMTIMIPTTICRFIAIIIFKKGQATKADERATWVRLEGQN